MKTSDGYFVLDAALVEKLMQEHELTRNDLLAAGIHGKSIRKMRNGLPVQTQTVQKFLVLLGVEADSATARLLKYGETSRAKADNVICLASWTTDGTPSAWKTAGNGLQYRVQMLQHRHTAGKRGRGKCYDLSQFNDQSRRRIHTALSRHHDVLEKVRRRPAFPCQADSGFADADHFWVIDQHEEGLTLTEYLSREELLGGGLSFLETVDIMEQVAAALLELHERNVIRRELTPDSILVQPDGHVLLTDLELCKLLGEYPTVVPNGIPASPWLAPELGELPVSDKVDVYSWGKIFLYAATGKVPPQIVATRDTELRGYPKGIRHLLASSTFAGYRSRPSIAAVIGALQACRISEDRNYSVS